MDESGPHFEHQPCKVFCEKGVQAISSQLRVHLTAYGPGICSSLCGACERSMPPMNVRAYFGLTGICPFNPGWLPESAIATCFLEVPMAINVQASPKLDTSDVPQPCGYTDSQPCGADES
ncbi:hypothetical protein LSH36_307g03001 [Paralvinella palmiformis]|uniref:Uncharacterized protein n=1 Tax=Paralvinella palmiformis TaxID=53620 RepID=A0AAD9JHJ7_9ANNE|nr:hypothetical protein LSH36_307g03001 [Paralvinella palmiformis]